MNHPSRPTARLLRCSWRGAPWLACILIGLSSTAGASAQTTRRLVTTAIDDGQTTVLPGNTRPEAVAANDRGAVADDTVFDHMQLLLKRPPEAQAALDRFTDEQVRPGSPDFHHWLTDAQMAARFGPARNDVAAVTNWLQGHGFRVDGLHNAGMIVDFSGTAGRLRQAFHTEMHRLDVRGAAHIANIGDPAIPTALSAVVHGIISLNDFRPDGYVERRTNYTEGNSTYALVPGDLAVIYNLAPLFKAGISGQGQTIAVVEDTDIYEAADWTTFRKAFHLNTYSSGSLTQVNPAGSGGACTNPGVVAGAEGEAILDAEWASAAAPSAQIVIASCADTSTTLGGLIALQNLIGQPSPPALVSVSYGVCEAYTGATENAAFNTVYQQAAAEGISVFVSSGDQLAAVCDRGAQGATHGIAVNGWGSTPYNVSVGGTDFSDYYSGTASTYWKTTNSKTYASAISYIPEIPWNDSCGSVLIATYLGYPNTYGADGFCNSSTGEQAFSEVIGGSGGPSACATGAPSKAGIVSGTCAGYTKPSWQKVFGNPSDGVRDLPDVSLFASQGPWGHYLVFCDSDVADGGAACTGAPSGWSGAGGTSFSSPIMAAIQSLVNQKAGSAQGNPNPVYYALAATEYGNKGSSKCNASLGNKVNKACIFRDVTLGDIDAPCAGGPDCYMPSTPLGALSTSPNSYKPAYATNAGWDFATGIGSVNAANLVSGWPTPQ